MNIAVWRADTSSEALVRAYSGINGSIKAQVERLLSMFAVVQKARASHRSVWRKRNKKRLRDKAVPIEKKLTTIGTELIFRLAAAVGRCVRRSGRDRQLRSTSRRFQKVICNPNFMMRGSGRGRPTVAGAKRWSRRESPCCSGSCKRRKCIDRVRPSLKFGSTASGCLRPLGSK